MKFVANISNFIFRIYSHNCSSRGFLTYLEKCIKFLYLFLTNIMGKEDDRNIVDDQQEEVVEADAVDQIAESEALTNSERQEVRDKVPFVITDDDKYPISKDEMEKFVHRGYSFHEFLSSVPREDLVKVVFSFIDAGYGYFPIGYLKNYLYKLDRGFWIKAIRDEAIARYFIENIRRLEEIEWFEEILGLALLHKDAAVLFTHHYRWFRDEEWAKPALFKALSIEEEGDHPQQKDSPYAAFIKKSEQFQDEEWFDDLLVQCLERVTGRHQFLLSLPDISDLEWFTNNDFGKERLLELLSNDSRDGESVVWVLARTLSTCESELWYEEVVEKMKEIWPGILIDNHRSPNETVRERFIRTMIDPGFEYQEQEWFIADGFGESLIDISLRDDKALSQLVKQIPKLKGDPLYRDVLIKLNHPLSKCVSKYPEALTGSESDKVTSFILLIAEKTDFDFSYECIEELVEFIEVFGAVQTPVLYQYFVNLNRLESKRIAALPDQQLKDGLTSVDALRDRFKFMRQSVISGDLPLADQMTKLDYDVLAVETMFYTSSWAQKDRRLEYMYRKFEEDSKEGLIPGVPEGYGEKALSVQKVKTNLDSLEHCEDEYLKIRKDLLGADNLTGEDGLENLKAEIGGLIGMELETINIPEAVEKLKAELIEAGTDEEVIDKRIEALRRSMNVKYEKLQKTLSGISAAETFDDVLERLLSLEKDLNIKKENSFTTPYVRRILFHKVMTNHSGYENLPEYLKYGEDVNLRGIQFVLDIVRNVVNQHVLNPDEIDKYYEGEWKPSKAELKKCRKILNVSRIHETLRRMEGDLDDSFEEISMIPDRGFVGELSGYYGEACFTRLYDMLKDWPNVIPHKLVINPNDAESREIVGSVLLIEATDDQGDKVIVVRAINPLDKVLNKLQTQSFCDEVFDKAEEVGIERGAKKILVSGLPGTVSNREKINIYISLERYWDTREKLSESLNFNQYELQNDCFLVREI